MTLVCVKDDYMVADSGSVGLLNGIVGHRYKIRRIRTGLEKGGLVACTGLTSECERFCAWAESGMQGELPHTREADEPFRAFMLLPSLPKDVLRIYDQNWHMPYHLKAPFFACGMGEPFAMGCMASGKSAEEAAILTKQYNTSVTGEIQVERLDLSWVKWKRPETWEK